MSKKCSTFAGAKVDELMLSKQNIVEQIQTLGRKVLPEGDGLGIRRRNKPHALHAQRMESALFYAFL